MGEPGGERPQRGQALLLLDGRLQVAQPASDGADERPEDGRLPGEHVEEVVAADAHEAGGRHRTDRRPAEAALEDGDLALDRARPDRREGHSPRIPRAG